MITAILGYGALIATIVGFALGSDKHLRLVNLLGCALWTVHLALLGAVAASLMLLMATVMVGASVLGRDQVSTYAWWLNVGITPIMIVLAMIGAVSWAAIPPIVAGLLVNTGVSRTEGTLMTALIAAGQLFWLLNGILVGSLPATVASILTLLALTVRTVMRSKQAQSSKLASA